MSTPSIASTTLSTHHLPYGYPHQNPYQANAASYPANNSVPAPRLTNSYHTFPSGHQSSSYQSVHRSPLHTEPALPTPSMPPSQSTSALSSRTQKVPDWKEYYKNGVPKEIIVIDDDTPPPPTPASQAMTQRGGRGGRRNVQATAGRKRKVDDSYDARYNDSPAFSVHPAKFDEQSSAPSVSTDRTTSLHTTAPTSLGSYGSSGASNSYEDVTVGQKRKRAPPKETRAQTKRKQQEATSDAFADYVPPPKPPIKAAEVHVPVIPVYRNKHQKIDDKIDDDDGHYIVTPGADFTDRYTIDKLLGQGTFGKVVEAWDKKKQTKCAVKIIRSVQKYRDASRIELRVLSTLSLNDKTNRNKCIHLRDSFDYRNHICIVTDLLGQSVFDFLKGNSFVPFPSTQIQSFARQLFTSVAFLHDLNLIHTDLKPENILLVNGAYQTFTYNRNIPSSSHITSRTARQRRVLLDSEIRLIDFGSATFDDEYHSTVVSTRHYRAPEIILQLGWSFPCDIWSIGCIIVEFFTGDALFQTHDNLEHLAMMEAVCNAKIDAKMIKQVQQASKGSNSSPMKYFNRNKLDYPTPETTRASRKYVKAMKRLQEFIPNNTTFNKQLLDLLRKIFVYDPKQRITAKQALKHPWFKEAMVDDGTEALRIRDQREEDARLAEARARADAQHQADMRQQMDARPAKRMREG